MWVGFVAYLATLAIAPRLPPRFLWGAILALLVLFAALPPLLSQDVYSYVDYARLGVLHGLDPYVHPPAAAPADPAFAEVAWTDATSAYGPLFTLLTYPLAWLSVGAAVAVLKALAAASVLALALTVARLAPLRGLDPSRAAALVALNPLVLVHVVGGGHNDGLAMAVAMVGVAAVLLARPILGGAALVPSIAIKASSAVIAPFALLAPPPTGRYVKASSTYPPIGRFLVGALGAALIVALVGQVAFGWDWLGAFAAVGGNQGRTSHMSLPVTAARLTGIDPDATRAAALALYALFLAALLTWTWRGGDWVRAAGWASLGLLLATAWLLPWYLIWVLPLAALSRDRTLTALTLALTAYQLGARIPL